MKTDDGMREMCALVRPGPFVFHDSSPSGEMFVDEPEKTDVPDRGGRANALRITAIDRAIIRDHYRAQPGFRAQRSFVAAGKWMRGRKLSMRAHSHALGDELETKLHPLPEGYARILAGNDVLLIDIATRRIIDVMRNVCTALGERASTMSE